MNVSNFTITPFTPSSIPYDTVDATKDLIKSILSFYNRFYNSCITGYIQAQAQIAVTKAAKGFSRAILPNGNNSYLQQILNTALCD